jgi:hypothetical protein
MVASGSSCRNWPKSRLLRKLTATRLNLLSRSEQDLAGALLRRANNGSGWSSQPQSIQRMRLQFNEPEVSRTQEFTVRWSGGPDEPLKEVVRQQWNFSPDGSTTESEDYVVDLRAVSILELSIDPDRGAGEALAKLADWRLG